MAISLLYYSQSQLRVLYDWADCYNAKHTQVIDKSNTLIILVYGNFFYKEISLLYMGNRNTLRKIIGQFQSALL